MPNWVMNKVKPKKDFDKVAKFVCGTEIDENGEYQEFDFDKIIPCPKRMNLTSGGIEELAIQYAILKRKGFEYNDIINKLKAVKCSFYGNYLDKITRLSQKNGKYLFDNEKLNKAKKDFEDKLKKYSNGGEREVFDNVDYEGLGIKIFEDLGNAYIDNILEYGCDTWYDWCNENWGTKWNCARAYIDNGAFMFETAWSCPFNVLKALSEEFSDIEFEIEYADEDIGSNCGGFILKNGIADNFFDGDREFAYKIWGYSQEDIDECESYHNEEE